ncbi:hypothetical protein [Agrobacterium tumefaciens]|uniref:hypothetical protein n=1 Tax=Agrobacterium tumefaciens TaxID=358 RepID=UPI0022055B0A|nr:hypothetical protein FY157_19640 [Agrobacterium tumefaciens]
MNREIFKTLREKFEQRIKQAEGTIETMRPHPEGETPFEESIKMQLRVIEECSGSIAFIDRYLSEPSTTLP